MHTFMASNYANLYLVLISFWMLTMSGIFYPISFYRRVVRFVAFQTKVVHHCFCLVRIKCRCSNIENNPLKDATTSSTSRKISKRPSWPLQLRVNRRESSGGMEWLGVWNCIFLGSEISNFGA